MAVPSTHDKVETADGKIRFYSDAGSLEVQMFATNFNPRSSMVAPGDGPLGRGVRGAIPLHLVFEATNIRTPIKYRLTLKP
jgi:hypothetical protein